MIRKALIGIIVLAVVGVLATTPAGAKSKLTHNFNGSDNKKLSRVLPLELTLTKDEIAPIRQFYLKGKGEAKRLRQDVIKKYYVGSIKKIVANLDLSKPGEKVPRGTLHMPTLAFMYTVFGKKEHGELAKKLLLYTVRLKTWTRYVNGRPYAPFKESNVLKSVLITFDLLNPLLTDSERKEVYNAVKIKGYDAINSFFEKYNKDAWVNRYPAYDAGPGYLQDSNQAAFYLGAMFFAQKFLYYYTGNIKYKYEYMINARAVKHLITKYFNRDGGVNAATGYYMLTLTQLADIVKPMARALKLKYTDFISPPARDPFKFLMYLRANVYLDELGDAFRYYIAFGDSTVNSFNFDKKHNKSLGVRWHAAVVWSSMFSDPGLLWIFNNYLDPYLKNGTTPLESPNTFVSYYYLDKIKKKIKAAPPLIENDKNFAVTGLVLWRDGFSKDDKLFAMQKRNYKRGDHLNRDQNVILLQAYGERYLAQRGVNYALDRKPGFPKFADSYNKNSITINYKNSSDGFNRQQMKPYFQTERLNFVKSDASYIKRGNKYLDARMSGAIAAIGDNVTRSVLYVKPDYYIVYDSVHTTALATMQNNFISYNQSTAKNELITYVGKKSKLYQYVVAPAKYKLVTGSLPDDRKQQTYRNSIETTASTTYTAFVNLFYPVKKGASPPVIETARNRAGAFINVKRGRKYEIILQKNYAAPKIVIKGYETDADLAVIFYNADNEIYAVGIFGGTYLIAKKNRIYRATATSSVIYNMIGKYIYGKANANPNTLHTFYIDGKKTYLTFSNADADGYATFSTAAL
ncbi:MAG: hypothetical protein L3J71_15525 [Victivallaceae bacterium]|nr:hypothetical protein [Victivallaceae bacterium]